MSGSFVIAKQKMLAARLHGINDFRTDLIPIPKPKGQELLMKIGACGICGSDIPRIFKLGTSKQKYPITLGHEFAGEIIAIGPDANKNLIGKIGAVFPCIPCKNCEYCESKNYAMCPYYDYLGSRSDGGFAEYCLIPSSWHFVKSNPFKINIESLCMVEPCSVAQHAIRKSKLTPGSSVLIYGAGPIGIMAARWAYIFGASFVMLVDIVDKKVQFAKERNLFAVNSNKENIVEVFKEKNNNCLPDIIIEGTGSGKALGDAIDCVRSMGSIILMGNPQQDTKISLSQHSNILRKEIILQGIWNSYFAKTPVNEWKFTVQMMEQGHIFVDDLITHKTDLLGLPGLCEDIWMQKIEICKAIYDSNN